MKAICFFIRNDRIRYHMLCAAILLVALPAIKLAAKRYGFY